MIWFDLDIFQKSILWDIWEVQTFLCDLLKDLAGYDLDGIFLDRGRFPNLQADFSEESRKQFEEYMQGQLDKNVLPNKDEAFLRTKILEMYTNPLKNHLATQE